MYYFEKNQNNIPMNDKVYLKTATMKHTRKNHRLYVVDKYQETCIQTI